ncbi:MAG: heavy-metal-associated domain-containing protein [Clostridia bacterium]|jgi:copper chaperone|nr:heavy-metal-associated domain-containing protein [Clostridia bacterium]
MTITLKVPGMKCQHCEAAVKGALTELEGVKSANVDLSAKTVTIEYENLDVAALKEAIEDVGFDVEE